MPDYPKRLIEVDLPIKQISAHARREKSIRHGHISTLHIWWARRPLAACRAVICAALWPDPADPLCPPDFQERAVRLIAEFAVKATTTKAVSENCSEYALGRWIALTKSEHALDIDNPAHMESLRRSLLTFIADFANWDNATVPAYLETARALTQAAHEALGGAPGTRPLVVDPFAGGGSIPLEALRVGADAFASDLNPVAVLLNKVVLEYIPRYGQRLVDEVRKWGQWIKEQAEQELKDFYPTVDENEIPIAYLWARTIICEGPGCGAEVPLIKSMWLGKKKNRRRAVRWVHDDGGRVATEAVEVIYADGVPRTLQRPKLEIFEPKKPVEVKDGTVRRGDATCPVCGYTTRVEHVREQLRPRRGGTSDARLFAVVTVRSDERGRFYRLPTNNDFEAIHKAMVELEKRRQVHDVLPLIPDEPLPPSGTLGFRVQRYGLEYWSDLFTARQLLALTSLVQKVNSVRKEIEWTYSDDFGEAVQLILAFNIDKLADYGSSLATWSSPASQETIRNTFTRQALPIAWDFAEAYPFASSSGGWIHNITYLTSPLEAEAQTFQTTGTAIRQSATHHVLPNDSVGALITDPPYYDAIPYADLSDYFVVWLKRSLSESSLATNLPFLSPKDEECVVDETKGHDHAFFLETMTDALKEGYRLTQPGGIGMVVFAHKSTEGWEAQLQALIDAKWIITGSWPIDTERMGRVRANASAALASSVHLVCRPRPEDETIGDWRDVQAELTPRIQQWMPRLQRDGIVGADAIFACIGPALEIYSRYSSVERANGDVIPLRDYLERVWAAVANEALSMIFEGADATGFEQDARLTAIWFWTLSTELPDSQDKPEADDEEPVKVKPSKGYTMEYDTARKLAQGLGADLSVLGRPGGIIVVRGKDATLSAVSARENHLIGVQLSLFGDAQPPKPKRRQRGTASMQTVDARQMALFDEQPEPEVDPDNPHLPGFAPEPDTRSLLERVLENGSSLLDRLHQAMLLFARGQTALLGPFLEGAGVAHDERFWRLAQALYALYPPGSEEKRWVDGVLGRKKSLGL